MFQISKSLVFYIERFKLYFILLLVVIILASVLFFNFKIVRNVYIFKLNSLSPQSDLNPKIKKALIEGNLKNNSIDNVYFLNMYYESFSLDNSQVVWINFLSKKNETLDEDICKLAGFTNCEFQECNKRVIAEKLSRFERCRYYEY